MCLKCRHYSVVHIGLMPEEEAAKCDALWKTWCVQNKEVIEKEVIDWLNRNSHVLRILNLGNLPKVVKRKPA